MHKSIIVGHLGRDFELQYSEGGTAFARGSVAASNRGGETVWFDLTAFGKTAEVCSQYGSKGRLVAVEGEPEAARGYTTKDGEVAASNKVIVRSIQFLDRREEPEQADEEDALAGEPA